MVSHGAGTSTSSDGKSKGVKTHSAGSKGAKTSTGKGHSNGGKGHSNGGKGHSNGGRGHSKGSVGSTNSSSTSGKKAAANLPSTHPYDYETDADYTETVNTPVYVPDTVECRRRCGRGRWRGCGVC